METRNWRHVAPNQIFTCAATRSCALKIISATNANYSCLTAEQHVIRLTRVLRRLPFGSLRRTGESEEQEEAPHGALCSLCWRNSKSRPAQRRASKSYSAQLNRPPGCCRIWVALFFFCPKHLHRRCIRSCIGSLRPSVQATLLKHCLKVKHG